MCVTAITVLLNALTQFCGRNLNQLLLTMGLLSFFGGRNESEDLQALLDRGAIIIDVRTPGEFNTGHVVGSINIPLDAISASIDGLKTKNVPVIACCASGNRSAYAASQLKAVGIEAVNGGSWYGVKMATDQKCE